ncbi:MAG: hypothetical protein ACMXYK_00850 [Candidatus Woesearchaeota archaeon]
MEQYDDTLAIAKQKIFVSEYMLSNTYELLKDPKLLLAILDNVHTAYMETLKSLLGYERFFKRIPSYATSLESMINVYSLKVQKRYDLDKKYAISMMEIKEILDEHKDAAVEFSRKEKLVIANDSYTLKTISKESLKKTIETCKEFLKKTEGIVSRA